MDFFVIHKYPTKKDKIYVKQDIVYLFQEFIVKISPI